MRPRNHSVSDEVEGCVLLVRPSRAERKRRAQHTAIPGGDAGPRRSVGWLDGTSAAERGLEVWRLHPGTWI